MTDNSENASMTGDEMRPFAAAEASALGALLDVEVPITISFGRRDLTLAEILRLSSGSVVDLDREAEDDVDILVNNQAIASGELVEVDGHYGVRIRRVLAAAPPAGLPTVGEGV